ncbi:E3 ubiquitin- ligase RNF43 [Labeo rohita]|uniref:E3 ubiquitin-ligase RNF43 n=1 Tax=Labeo rohita TaxID=84645 RepID=A0A498NKP6_LABRO|nr:E3 ubiquitin- ligase RNF43 [Labeo rohita]
MKGRWRSHPLSLCNTSEDDRQESIFISIVKLESPESKVPQCQPLLDKINPMQMFPSEDITEFNGSFRPDADFLQSRVVRQIERETGAADNVRPFHKASQSGLVRRYEKSSKYLPKTAHSLPHNPNIPCVSG